MVHRSRARGLDTTDDLDMIFDSDGTSLASGASQPMTLRLRPDGKIVAAGTHYYNANLLTLACNNPDEQKRG